MSFSVVYVIPLDEKYIPDNKSIKKILRLIDKRNEHNLKIGAELNDDIQFYDCGENFESVNCPYCNKQLDSEWWGNAMSNAFETNFSDLNIITPCCNKKSSLNRLNYSFPQGFARFAVKIEDYEPDKLQLDEKLLSELKNITGQEWKVVFARY